MALTRLAPAKLNLALHVVGQRADGYHLLESIVTFADAGDRVGVSEAAADRFTVSGPFASHVPLDAEGATGNLVLKARDGLRALAAARGLAAGPVHLHLEKNLPVQSGIGGGSADAAAALSLLCDLWNLDGIFAPPSPSGALPLDLAALALTLGADVPMCLAGVPALITGIGEGITPLPTLPALPAILVNPRVGVSTPAIFRLLTQKTNPPLTLPAPAATPAEWLSALAAMRNDLAPPARTLEPAIGAVEDALTDAGAVLVRMSGSGATCFGLFADRNARDRAATQLGAERPGWYVQPCHTRGAGDDKT
ncbi:4-(cytidine 5'-diphospho)-2-C-methyl-D-erythritol kinase [Rhizobium sp. RU20A]|uniref:4-(cytidine 5'-diphospho)-2-C-methyl-D-erythritol kinase n=1 Tax=Rhizobium sp. RU20A TaxID=1907412 RepID=UPI00122C6603|nr:4-(cytidine 5'-diphospho)-2-C-methyl-D-erythritol kinase [Rhizobium sp. RU20A]